MEEEDDVMQESHDDTKDDTILAQVDPNLETILEEGTQKRQSREQSPTGSTMSLRSRGSRMSGVSESQEMEGWTIEKKQEVKLLREQIKQYDSSYRGHIRNDEQLKKAQKILEGYQNQAYNINAQ